MVMVKPIYDLNDEGFKQRLAEVEAHHKKKLQEARQKIYDACQIIANEQPMLNTYLTNLEALEHRQPPALRIQWWMYAKAQAEKPDATEVDKARFKDVDKAERSLDRLKYSTL
jgi:hypothetical protein